MKTVLKLAQIYTLFRNHLLHTAIDIPPEMRNAPEKAHVKLEYMSFGVISL